jgi:ABC-2 type transport system permease protein
MLSAGLLGVLILLLMINTALKFGFKKVVGILAVGYAIVIIIFFKISSPMDTVLGVMKYFPDVDRYFADLIPPYIKFLPNNWLAEAMYWTSKGDVLATIPYSILQICLTSFLLIVVILVGNATYLKTWHKSIDFRENRDTKSTKPSFFSFQKKSRIKVPFNEVLMKRDFHLFIREPAQIIHFSVLFFLILVFVASLPGLSFLASKRVVLFTFVFLAVYIFNIFFIITLTLRYIFPLISLEGSVIWKVKSAPIDTRKLLRKRLVIPLIVILSISQIMSICIVARFSVHLIIPLGIVSFASSLFLILMSFGMGGLFINLKEKNPVRLSSSQGASISFLFSMIYLILLISLLYFPLSQFFREYIYLGIYEVSGVYLISAVVLAVSVISGWFFYRIGVRSLERDV